MGWDLRELCNKLKPLGTWNDVHPHNRFKTLPVVNIDLLGHEDGRVREEAVETFVVSKEGAGGLGIYGWVR